MHQTLPFLFVVVIVIVLVQMLAKKLNVAYPILVVVAGLLVSLIPSVPTLRLNPDWVFFVFLPPLLFDAAWSISFKGLKRWWRIIGSFSFLVVFFTATAVAFFANSFIPGFSLALGFLLGGIVSPPDAVSAGAIMKFVNIPKSTATILEGESLFNDASSLIIFRFAMIAVATGQFIWSEAIFSFSWMVLGGVGIGLLIGWIFMQAHKRLPMDAPSNIVFTLIEPFILYWVAEQVHSSGVMAVVTGGLFLANRRFRILNSEARIRGFSFWQSFVFLLNGVVFFVIGLDLKEVVEGLNKAGVSIGDGIFYGIIVTAFIIFIRIVASFIALFSTFLFRRSIIAPDFSFKKAWSTPLVLGWTGMRGVVSLAAACSIPVYLDDGTAFPQRELILFISFMVIILTLFVQGLTLPFILRRVKLNRMIKISEGEKSFETQLRRDLWQFSIKEIEKKYHHHIEGNVFLASALAKWQQKLDTVEEALVNAETKTVYLELLEAQRQFLIEKNKASHIEEEVIRKEITLIDIEEEKVKLL
ncbi:Na+/H+ antiporter [Niabella insulamsoli]|uniref:Na+/H+ antiporter n=1 Tax=Niabella insulamsoli TaxID=3144874 RepID=UPI0031FD84D4